VQTVETVILVRVTTIEAAASVLLDSTETTANQVSCPRLTSAH